MMKRVILFFALCLTVLGSVQGAVVHRYGFNGDPNDSVGTANGVLVRNLGPSASIYQGGQLILGNDGNQYSNANNGDYVNLPNGTISSLGTAATFEMWFTWNLGGNWQRLFDFGVSDGGEDASTSGETTRYIFLTPQSGDNTCRFGYQNNPPREERTLNTAIAPIGAQTHVAVTWNEATQTVTMYVNGVQVDSNTLHMKLSDLNDINNWLGRAQWGDQMYVGSYNEFRIYNNALNASEVAASLAAGTEMTIATPVSPYHGETEVGTQPTLTWAPGYLPQGASAPTYKVYLSSDQAAVSSGLPSALIAETATTSTTLSAALSKDTTYFWRVDLTTVLPGTSEPNAIAGGVVKFETEKTYPVLTYGKSAFVKVGDTASMTVAIATESAVTGCQWFKVSTDPNAADMEMTGVVYSDTETTLTIDAAELGDEGNYYCVATNGAGSTSSKESGLIFLDVRQGLVHRYSFTTDASDSVGTANGELLGGAAVENGMAVFAGTAGNYINLPAHLLQGMTGVTFMVWVNPGRSEWSRIFDFGDTVAGGTAGINYFFLAPTGRFAIKNNSSEQAIDSGFAMNALSQVVCVYDADGASNTMRLYVNGELKQVRTNCFPISVVNDVNCWIGRSHYTGDPAFLGSIDEFRIFDMPLNNGWVKAYYEKGPDSLPTDACVAPPLFDVAGNDCVVDMNDFAVFAASWLECGLDSCQ